MRTRSQTDAIRVLKQVRDIRDAASTDAAPTDLKIRYAALAYRFPLLILRNGLQQTIGFLEGKAGSDAASAEYCFLRHIAEMLDVDPRELSEVIANAGLADYRRHTRRCLSVAIWYRRFAESLLGLDPTGNATMEDEDVDTDATT
ncbi:MAG TPA: type III-B CRISPR module-associated protein Cmr5 [Gammaproteobacteria bacterium]|nr:type III-B CRISPR module-associated protein Cmr5 [Gammaproteobacteria bacterium]